MNKWMELKNYECFITSQNLLVCRNNVTHFTTFNISGDNLCTADGAVKPTKCGIRFISESCCDSVTALLQGVSGRNFL